MPKLSNKVVYEKGKVSLEDIIKSAKQLDGAEAAAGYDDKVHSSSGLGLASLAYLHEMGAPQANIQSRDFMTQAHYENERTVSLDELGELVEQIIYYEADPDYELNQLADELALNIPFILNQGNFVVTNNPTPLIETGELREGVETFVSTGGKKI